MYRVKLTLDNKTFCGTLEESNLTPEQIRIKTISLLQPSVSMHVARHKLKKREVVDGKEIDVSVIEMANIEYEEVVVEEAPGVEKVYELPSLEGLTRKQLLEQEILLKKKLQKVAEALIALERQEREAVENSLKEEVA